MVDLPEYRPKGITAEAPQQQVSAQAIQSQGDFAARALSKVGEGLEDVSVPLAEEAGKQAVQKAVTRNPDGSISVDTPQTSFILGRGGNAYARTVEAGTIAQLQTKIAADFANLHQQFAGDPDGFRKAAGAYTDRMAGSVGDKLGLAVRNLSENYATQHYDTLVNNKASLDLQRNVSAIDTGLTSAKSDLLTLARSGVTSGPQWDNLNARVTSLTAAKTADPRIAYPKETADYDLDQFHGQLGAQGFLYHVDQVYRGNVAETQGASAPQKAAAALESAKSILTDQSLKLDQAKRLAYYHQAVGEIRANEAIRKQDVFEARAALQDLNMAAVTGQPIAPEMVESLAQQFRAAGDPAGAARVYAMYARKPLNDAFSTQPLQDQTDQFNALRSGRVADAIHMQESGGKLTAATSVTGATGGWQIQPQTFKRYALPGENINNPEDNERVGRRIVADLAQKTGGDPARIAVGYFSGEGNIAPPGSPTPYIKDKADPNGKTTSSYVADVLRNMNSGAAGGGPSASTPAGAAWLQTNRSRELDKNAWASWQTVMKDYDQKGTVPSQSTVDQVISAAHATNNQALLETVAQDADRMDLAHLQQQRPLPQQQADISTLKAAGNEGSLSPGQAAVLNDLERRFQQITTGLKDNPIQTTVAAFSDRFKAPPPLDFSTPQALAAGLQQRGRIAQFAAQNWQTQPVSALDSADLNSVKAVVEGNDLQAKATLFSAISTLPEDVRTATLNRLAEKGGPDAAVSVAAGNMLSVDRDVAQSIMRGQNALKMDQPFWPEKTDGQAAVEKLNKLLPASAFGVAARTDPQGPLAIATGMVKARYADLSAQVGDTSGKLSEPRLTQAVNDVTGGVLYHNGGPFIAPARGMPQPALDAMLAGVTDADMAGATTLNGQPVTAEYLRNSAQLESIGQGRYLVRLGADPSRPIYAYTGANTEQPQKFVFDLRGRAPTPEGMRAYRAGLTQAGQVTP